MKLNSGLMQCERTNQHTATVIVSNETAMARLCGRCKRDEGREFHRISSWMLRRFILRLYWTHRYALTTNCRDGLMENAFRFIQKMQR